MKNFLSCGLLFLFLLGCSDSKKPDIAFYYWKTLFRLSQTEKKTLTENNVKKIYLRYFDISMNTKGIPFPESPIHFSQSTAGFIVVPVVYIKNKVFLNPNIAIRDLAEKTNSFITQINLQNKISCREIQIDCDWTLESKVNYMKFVAAFKKISDKKLSATIRLHQIKYFRKTGIPNVDHGVLMYYNMGKIGSDTMNSIYDKKIAALYLKSLKKYPLKLDVAIPIYSWGIHIQNGKVLGLKNKIAISSLQKDSNFIPLKNSFFRVKNSNYKKGTFYKKNDLIKQEYVTASDLLQMGDDLSEDIGSKPKEIIFYDLDDLNIKQYEKSIFKQITDCF